MKKMLPVFIILNAFAFFASTIKSSDSHIRALLHYCNYGYDYQGEYSKESVENLIVNSKEVNFQMDNPKRYGYAFITAESTPLHVAICSSDYWSGSLSIEDEDFSDFYDEKTKKEELDKLELYNKTSDERRLHTICLLLENPNINLNLQDRDGNTPLMQAVRFDPLRFDLLGDLRYRIIIELLRKGANVTIKNNAGESFLDYVARDPELYLIYQAHQDVVEFQNEQRIKALNDVDLKIPQSILKIVAEYVNYAPDLPK